jgi:hypothetical protein
MNDFGSQYPQQYASAGAVGRPAGPPPRPPMPGTAQGRPAPRPQHLSAQHFPAQQFPAQQPHPAQQFGAPGGPAPRPYGPQGPAHQSPAHQSPAHQGPAQQFPARPQPGPTGWQPPAQGSGPARPGPATPGPWPAPDAAAALTDDPAAVPPRKRGRAGKVIGVLVVVAALGGVGWVLATGGQSPVTAAVGECVTQTGADDIAVVGCGEPTAQFKVAGKLENRTVIDASLFACSDFPEATSSYWQGVEGKPGTVLCLAPLKPAAPADPAAPAAPATS